MRHHEDGPVFTPLHRIEIRNATAHGEITEAERKGAFRRIAEDLRDGSFVHTPFSWTDTLRRADELSKRERRLACAAGRRVKP